MSNLDRSLIRYLVIGAAGWFLIGAIWLGVSGQPNDRTRFECDEPCYVTSPYSDTWNK